MTTLQLTLFVLLLTQTCGQKPEPVFRPVGKAVELGYCFGTDYMLVYRVLGERDQLISNSSDVSPPVTLPADLQGRVLNSHLHQLMGMQIKKLIQGDSGLYRRDCWKNGTRISQHTQLLIVCDSEIKSEEIIVNSEAGGTEILCNSSAIGEDGVSVRWYHDVYPSYAIELLMDSLISLDPVSGVLEVKNHGATLVLDKSMLNNNQHFFCEVYKEEHCLTFQNLYVSENHESKNVFASQGEEVLLYCQADGENQRWETPVGKVESIDERNHHMRISTGEKSQHFSLEIHSATDEHFGDYACISSTSETQYTLVLCPKKPSSEKFTYENHDVTLQCDTADAEADLYIVHWYRRQKTRQHELICDSGDESVPIPEDLRGRLSLTDNGATLMISRVKRADEGTYWCVVLKGTVFRDDEDYDYDTNEGEEGEEGEEGGEGGEDEEGDSEMGFDWGNEKCLFKQETYLSVNPKLSTPPTVRLAQPESVGNGQAATRAEVTLVGISLVTMFVLVKDR